MTPITVEQWCAALRSGKYAQVNGWLCIDRKQFCCLGVAACEAGVDPALLDGERMLMERVVEGVKYVRREFGLDIIVGDATASDFNDVKNMTFPQIADEIEKHYGVAR